MEQEQIWIRQLRAGKKEAFRHLVESYQDMVFTICMQIIKSRELAEEAAQDVFIKVYQNIQRFEQRSSFRTWLYRIAYRTAIDEVRKKARVNQTSLEIAESGITSLKSDSAEGEMEVKERENVIEQAINQLKEDESLIVRLFYLEEKNIKEISKIMGLSESNVKVKLFRSRSRLREILYPIKDKI